MFPLRNNNKIGNIELRTPFCYEADASAHLNLGVTVFHIVKFAYSPVPVQVWKP